MSLHIYCKTSQAVLLLGCETEEGPMRFPSQSTDFPGIIVAVDATRPINEQLAKAAVQFLGAQPRIASHIDISQEYSEVFNAPRGGETTLYVATLHFRHRLADHKWPTMPELLRSMPKDRTRLPYLKAWQLLLGGLAANTKVVDFEEILKHFES